MKPTNEDIAALRRSVSDYILRHGTFDQDGSHLILRRDSVTVYTGDDFIRCLTDDCTLEDYAQAICDQEVYFGGSELIAAVNVLGVRLTVGVCDSTTTERIVRVCQTFEPEAASRDTKDVLTILHKNHFSCIVQNLRAKQVDVVAKLFRKFASPPNTGADGTFNELTDAALRTIANVFDESKVFFEIGGGVGKSLLHVGLLSDCSIGVSIEYDKARWRQSVRVFEELANLEINVPLFIPSPGDAAECKSFEPAQNVLFYSKSWDEDDIVGVLMAMDVSTSVEVLVTDAPKALVKKYCSHAFMISHLGSLPFSVSTGSRVFRVFRFEFEVNCGSQALSPGVAISQSLCDAVENDDDDIVRVFAHELVGMAEMYHMTKPYAKFLRTQRPPERRLLRSDRKTALAEDFMSRGSFSPLVGLERRVAENAHHVHCGYPYRSAFSRFQTDTWFCDENLTVIADFATMFKEHHVAFMS
jgi:hypothetical protein